MRNIWFLNLVQRLALGVLACAMFLSRNCTAAGGPAPIIVLGPLSQTVRSGDSVTFLVIATSLTTMTYQWRKDNMPISGANQSSFTIASARSSDEGVYSVKVTNSGGSVTSAGATLTVITPAGIATQPKSQVMVAGTEAKFTVEASGTPPFTYQWCFNGQTIAEATGTRLRIDDCEPALAGDYTVVVANSWGSITSAIATLTVLVPPTITAQPQSISATVGEQVGLAVGATGTAPLRYQWSFNGVPLPGATDSTLTFNNSQSANAGAYTVTVANSVGSARSAVAMVALTNPPSALSVPTAKGMPAQGFTFQLTVPTGCTYVIFASTDLWTWQPISTNFAQAATVAFTDPEAINYPQRFYRAMVP